MKNKRKLIQYIYFSIQRNKMAKSSPGFTYIDDELQNLRQLLNFRLDDVLPKEPLPCSSKGQMDMEVVTMETNSNNDVVVVDHRPLTGKSFSVTS